MHTGGEGWRVRPDAGQTEWVRVECPLPVGRAVDPLLPLLLSREHSTPVGFRPVQTGWSLLRGLLPLLLLTRQQTPSHWQQTTGCWVCWSRYRSCLLAWAPLCYLSRTVALVCSSVIDYTTVEPVLAQTALSAHHSQHKCAGQMAAYRLSSMDTTRRLSPHRTKRNSRQAQATAGMASWPLFFPWMAVSHRWQMRASP